MSRRFTTGGATAARGLALTAALLAGSATLASAAETKAQVRVKGEVSSVDGRQITVQTQQGESARVELAPDAKIYGLSAAKPEAIATDSIVSAAGIPEKEKKEAYKAVTVVIYPKDLGGTTGGYLSWDAAPDTAMTNGVVQAVKDEGGARVVSLYYPQGGSTLTVGPDAKVMMLQAGDQAMLKKGAHIFVPTAEKRSDGTYTAQAIVAGKDGYVPPM